MYATAQFLPPLDSPPRRASIYNPLASQWLGRPPPPEPLAQLITVKLVVYAMATKPKMHRKMSDHLRSAVLATAL